MAEHDEHDEEVARFRAVMDQAMEGVKATARASWAFFREAKDQGFDDVQALKLTVTWLAAITQAQNGDE